MGDTAVHTPLSQLSEQEYQRRIRAWTMYDWANSAFATTILAAVLPAYFSSVAGATLSSAAQATQYWSLTLSVTVFIVALISPILGTVSDVMRGKKKFLSIFVTIGVIGTGLLILIDRGDWLLAAIFFGIGRIGFASANVFYDALLPHIAKEEDQDRVSTQGYAIGYLGGGLLLAINVVMIQMIPGNWGIRLSMFSVAIWWALFSIPIFRRVPEPASAIAKLKEGESIVRVSFTRIVKTIREIREYKELFKYLVAFLIYNDGIGTIITIAAIYVAELGFGLTESVLAILLVQFVGIPYSLIFGNLPSKSNKRQTMFVAFVLFNIVALPTAGIAGRYLLDKEITGTPSEPFATVGAFMGEGVYGVNALDVSGWETAVISADILGTEEDAAYASNSDNSRLEFTYNGQQVELTHSIGPDHGIWQVEIDGELHVDDATGEIITIDAYSENLRYEEVATFRAKSEGEHTLALLSTGNKAEDSSGSLISIAQIEVEPPLRTSNLGMILGILIGVELIGVAFAFLLGPRLFKGIAQMLDTKRSIIIALIAYSLIAVWGFFLNSVVEFWFLAWMVGVVQGGSQALSRSLYAAMSPTAMSGEFFGFFSIMSKFASFLSPLLFAAAIAIFGNSRPGVLSLIIFFLIGIYLLSRVDVEEGKRVAKEKDRILLGTATD